MILRVLVTLALLAAAALGVRAVYQKYFRNPWTRDGQVRAQVVQVAPRISAPVVKLVVVDNQFVKAGDLLFELDPRTFAANLDQARAQVEVTKDNYNALEQQVRAAGSGVIAAEASVTQAQSSIKEAAAQVVKNEAELARQKNLLPQSATSQRSVDSAQASYDIAVEKKKTAEASLTQMQASLAEAKANLLGAKANRGAQGDANANLQAALAELKEAELNMEFTKVLAPVDGYVTNITLQIGTQAVANQPMLALVDVNSFWVVGFFRETQIARVVAGDRAMIKLMSYPKQPFEARVESLGWGIAQQDGSPGVDLLPAINPTFDWIRLAQRIPVRIRLDKLPEGVDLRVGTTASVIVYTDSE